MEAAGETEGRTERAEPRAIGDGDINGLVNSVNRA